jgi:acetyltransferase-like isoleucine patch superfamily enzyme
MKRDKLLIERNSIIYRNSNIVIRSGGHIRIGKNCSIGRRKKSSLIGLYHMTSLVAIGTQANIQIGNNVCLNGVAINAKSHISIGDNCRIASGVMILDHNGHEVESLNSALPIHIGNNVWIGLNAIILKGCVIPDNCIVAAGSVVKGKFEPNSIIQGNPGVVIRKIKI